MSICFIRYERTKLGLFLRIRQFRLGTEQVLDGLGFRAHRKRPLTGRRQDELAGASLFRR
jgi:hypothetical protein